MVFIIFSQSIRYRNTNQTHWLHKNYFSLCIQTNKDNIPSQNFSYNLFRYSRAFHQ